ELRMVDLLSEFDPKKGAVAGHLMIDEKGLISADDPQTLASFRYRPPEEFDFHVDFTIVSAKPNAKIGVSAARGKLQFDWYRGVAKGARTGFEFGGAAPIGTGFINAATLADGRRHSLVLMVRRRSIIMAIDGVPDDDDVVFRQAAQTQYA